MAVDGFIEHELGGLCNPATGQFIGKSGRAVGSINKKTGYVTVGNTEKTMYCHRLMWQAAVGPIPTKMDINHKNGIKTDNRLCNLEVVTRTENLLHAYRMGLNHGNRKIPDSVVREIRDTSSSISGNEWHRRTGISRSSISQIRNGKIFKNVI